MRPVVTLAATFVLYISNSYAQAPKGASSPFRDRADTGETIHVLPTPASVRSPQDTQPTDAPVANGTAVYPASFGSGNLNYHGGTIVANAGFYAIYWNSTVAMSAATSLGYTTIRDQIQGFVTNFADNAAWDNSATDDYEI